VNWEAFERAFGCGDAPLRGPRLGSKVWGRFELRPCPFVRQSVPFGLLFSFFFFHLGALLFF